MSHCAFDQQISTILFVDRLTDAQSQYVPVNLADTLQEIRGELRDLNNNVRTGRAETANALLRLRNRFINPMDPIPVQKTVCHGIILHQFHLLTCFFHARCQDLVFN